MNLINPLREQNVQFGHWHKKYVYFLVSCEWLLINQSWLQVQNLLHLWITACPYGWGGGMWRWAIPRSSSFCGHIGIDRTGLWVKFVQSTERYEFLKLQIRRLWIENKRTPEILYSLRLWAGVQVPAGAKIFFSLNPWDQLQGPPRLSIGYRGLPGIKRPEHDIDHSPSSSTEFKNRWSHACASPTFVHLQLFPPLYTVDMVFITH